MIRALGLSLALLLACLVAIVGASRVAVSHGRTDIALSLWGARGAAAAKLAQEAQRNGDSETAARMARRALSASVTRSSAISTLALSSGDAGAAASLMGVAAQWGWRDPSVQFWLLGRAAAAGDFPQVFLHLDALLRQQLASPEMFAILTNAAVLSADAARAAVPHLEGRPKWRSGFFESGWAASNGAETGFERLVLLLSGTTAPPSREELTPYAESLQQRAQFARAGRLWERIFQSDTATMPRAGELRLEWPATVPGRAPFGWYSPGVAAGELTLARDETGRLSVAHWVETETPIVRRILVLPAGRYRLSPADGNVLPGLSWSSRCLPNGRELQVSEGSLNGDLKIDAGCAAVELSLRPQRSIQPGGQLILPSFSIRRT